MNKIDSKNRLVFLIKKIKWNKIIFICYKENMKSVKFPEMLVCPNGCEPFEADRWSFINVTHTPELKDAALGGELNLFCCPQCNTFFHADTDLIYLDEQAALLVFVFSDKNRRNKKELLAKMEKDYAVLKDSLFKQMKLDFGPMYVFGLEELKEVVLREQQRTDESEAIAAAAAALGMKVARLAPQWARQHHSPLYVAVGGDETAGGYAAAARKVLQSGLKSPLLAHFAEIMEGEGASAPNVL